MLPSVLCRYCIDAWVGLERVGELLGTVPRRPAPRRPSSPGRGAGLAMPLPCVQLSYGSVVPEACAAETRWRAAAATDLKPRSGNRATLPALAVPGRLTVKAGC